MLQTLTQAFFGGCENLSRMKALRAHNGHEHRKSPHKTSSYALQIIFWIAQVPAIPLDINHQRFCAARFAVTSYKCSQQYIFYLCPVRRMSILQQITGFLRSQPETDRLILTL